MITVCAPSAEIIAAYKRLVAEIDDAVSGLIGSRFTGKLQCRPGCSSCCKRFSVLPLEAAMIFIHLNAFVKIKQAMAAEEYCNFLQNDLCSIYESRPIICRTQGVPLGYIDELQGAIEVSACELNFPAEMALEYDDLLMLDDFNMRLARLNLEYCLNCQLDPEQRIALASLLGEHSV